jgi:DNA-directed RNA polymerase specialized sigma subunit
MQQPILVSRPSELSERAIEELNAELYPRVAGDDKQAINQMILANVPLATLRVNRFLGKHEHRTYLYDDLICAAYLGLTKGVNGLVGNWTEQANIPAYLSVAIDREIFALVKMEYPIWVPPKKYREMDSEERKKYPKKKVELPNIGRHMLDKDAEIDPRDQADANVIAHDICHDDIDKRILDLSETMSEREIAKECGITRYKVRTRKAAIQGRYLRLK